MGRLNVKGPAIAGIETCRNHALDPSPSLVASQGTSPALVHALGRHPVAEAEAHDQMKAMSKWRMEIVVAPKWKIGTTRILFRPGMKREESSNNKMKHKFVNKCEETFPYLYNFSSVFIFLIFFFNFQFPPYNFFFFRYVTPFAHPNYLF